MKFRNLKKNTSQGLFCDRAEPAPLLCFLGHLDQPRHHPVLHRQHGRVQLRQHRLQRQQNQHGLPNLRFSRREKATQGTTWWCWSSWHAKIWRQFSKVGNFSRRLKIEWSFFSAQLRTWRRTRWDGKPRRCSTGWPPPPHSPGTPRPAPLPPLSAHQVDSPLVNAIVADNWSQCGSNSRHCASFCTDQWQKEQNHQINVVWQNKLIWGLGAFLRLGERYLSGRSHLARLL